MAGKRAPYTGGPWQVGGIRSNRPPVSPATRRALLLRYIEHAQRRIDEGFGQVYTPLLLEYRRELLAVSHELAQNRRGAAAGVPSGTPETVTGQKATVSDLTVQLPERVVSKPEKVAV